MSSIASLTPAPVNGRAPASAADDHRRDVVAQTGHEVCRSPAITRLEPIEKRLTDLVAFVVAVQADPARELPHPLLVDVGHLEGCRRVPGRIPIDF